ncbi:DedA family protein [Candidatus Saccharibacteria bacterium]|nr:DedA family protein [Candidatus Saccharibacteria bacterium]
MEPLIDFITSIGFIAVLLVIFAESGLLIGFFLPGDSLLFAAGYLVYLGNGAFNINIHAFVALLWLAAVLGDNVGYAFGYRVGRKLFQKPNSRFFKKEYLIETEKFFDKHGPKAIVLARFVPIVRTFTPIIAGTSKMNYRTFFIYNVVGGFLWVTLFTYLGYFIGQQLTNWGINIEVVAIIIVLLSVLPMIIHILQDKTRRERIITGTKHQLRVLLKRR